VAVAILNALATEFGVQIRTTAVNSSGTTPDPDAILSARASNPPAVAKPPYGDGEGLFQ
jgi:hypothetical protein